jgi:hypothetical protein
MGYLKGGIRGTKKRRKENADATKTRMRHPPTKIETSPDVERLNNLDKKNEKKDEKRRTRRRGREDNSGSKRVQNRQLTHNCKALHENPPLSPSGDFTRRCEVFKLADVMLLLTYLRLSLAEVCIRL